MSAAVKKPDYSRLLTARTLRLENTVTGEVRMMPILIVRHAPHQPAPRLVPRSKRQR